jgi:hypothetical protein
MCGAHGVTRPTWGEMQKKERRASRSRGTSCLEKHPTFNVQRPRSAREVVARLAIDRPIVINVAPSPSIPLPRGGRGKSDRGSEFYKYVAPTALAQGVLKWAARIPQSRDVLPSIDRSTFSFCRPGGALSVPGFYPQLKLRAIFGRRDAAMGFIQGLAELNPPVPGGERGI